MTYLRLSQSDASGAQDALLKDLRLDALAVTTDRLAVIASVLRRLCGIMCPCPQHALFNATKRSLLIFPALNGNLEDDISAAIEDLLTCGDLLELAQVILAGAEDKPTWLFCAPPSFVERSNRIYIFGIAPDDASFLPNAIRMRLCYEGAARFLDGTAEENLADVLASLGLRRISKDSWLTQRKPDSANSYVTRLRARLQRDGGLGNMPDLQVLNRANAEHKNYAARWSAIADQSGIYIGRSPQPYGAPLWYLVDISKGVVAKSLFLPFLDTPMRAADLAWQIQLAIDADHGFPSTYSYEREDDGYRINFSFPLPSNAARRLVFFGGRRRASGSSRFSFWITESQLADEEVFLQKHLWLIKAY